MSFEKGENYEDSIAEWKESTKRLSEDNTIFAFMPGQKIGEFTK